jgi:hypothetical protein
MAAAFAKSRGGWNAPDGDPEPADIGGLGYEVASGVPDAAAGMTPGWKGQHDDAQRDHR